jgi:hypothetical protein
MNTNSLNNLKKFEKGNKCGKGRPPASMHLKKLLRKSLEADICIKDETRTAAEWIVISLIRRAIKGEIPAIKEVFDRRYGKVPQQQQISNFKDQVFKSAMIQVDDPDQELLDRYYEERKRLELENSSTS